MAVVAFMIFIINVVDHRTIPKMYNNTTSSIKSVINDIGNSDMWLSQATIDARKKWEEKRNHRANERIKNSFKNFKTPRIYCIDFGNCIVIP